MRLGMLDIGSNSVKLQVVDAEAGGPPLPAHAFKAQVRTSESTRPDGAVDDAGIDRVADAVSRAATVATAQNVDELIAFTTAWLRNAPNRREIQARLDEAAGIPIRSLSGDDEARLTFLAARRWYGWSAGRLLLVDIGGGSLEIAFGRDEEPDVAVSLPLGAGRTTRVHLTDDPPQPEQVDRARRQARHEIGQVADRLRWESAPSVTVASSKTFKQLARLAGAAPGREGPFVSRSLDYRDLRRWTHRLATMDADERATQRGISRSRADQIVGGAIVAEVAMAELCIDRLEICPWALREGILLRRLDRLRDPAEEHDVSLIARATVVAPVETDDVPGRRTASSRR